MKKFLIRSALFLVPVILLLSILEYGLGKVQNTYNTKRNNLEKQLDSIEVLLIGNSRTLYGVNPAYFSRKGYNLSNISQTMFYISELGIRYVPQMPKLRCVIIEVSPQSLGVDLIDGKEHWRDFYYSQFWSIDYPENKWYDIKRYSKFFLYQPLQSCYYASRLFKVNLAQDLHRNGWLFVRSPKTREFINNDMGKKRAAFNEGVYKENRFQRNAALLEKLIVEIQKHHAVCILITSPAFETFTKYADKTIAKKRFQAIQRIADTYHCPYVNYFYDKRYTIDDYADNDHFCYIGAQKYSKIINAEIVEKYCQ